MTETPTVRVQRLMPAPPDEVFDEWLDPESLKEWMCPHPTRVVDVSLDARVGGLVRFDVDNVGVPMLITGQFLEIDRPRLLRLTWSNSDWPDPTTESIVEVTFTPADNDETLMSIEHRLLPPTEFEDFHSGWIQTFDQLAERLTG